MGWFLEKLFLLIGVLFTPFASRHLARRAIRGKEDPERVREKLGHASQPRPAGRLVWIHAVGLGEVLSTRAIETYLLNHFPDTNILITSGTVGSASVIDIQMSENVIHQFLPLDCPRFVKRFLDHWRPDQVIWVEQDLWPGLIKAAADRNIPQAWINARMNRDAHARRARWSGLYRRAYDRLGPIMAQDETSATLIGSLCAGPVAIAPSLKVAAPALRVTAPAPAHPKRWVLASAHLADLEIALRAQKKLPGWQLVIVPRFPADGDAMRAQAVEAGFDLAGADGEAEIILDAAFGTLARWLDGARFALIGGGFDATEGHNPWEAVPFGAAVLSGPNTQNFAADYRALVAAGGAVTVANSAALAMIIRHRDPEPIANNAATLRQALSGQIDQALGQLFTDGADRHG